MKAENHLIARIPIKDRTGRITGHKEVARYAGLLSKAHEDGLSVVLTELVQAPGKDNGETAIVRATVQTSKGSFTGIGDASPENVNAGVVRHLLRVAETRAKARALRDAVNIGTVSLEELGAEIEDDALYEGKVVPVQEGGNGRRETAPREAAIPAGGKSTARPAAAATTATRDATSMSHPTATATVTTTPPVAPRTGGPRTSLSAPFSETPNRTGAAMAKDEPGPATASSTKPPPFFTGTETFNVGAEHGTPQVRPMTDSQRRYLFRLLAKRGVMGNDAKETLQKVFGVEHLREVSREAASALIDRLIQEDEEAGAARAAQGTGRAQGATQTTTSAHAGNGKEARHGNP